MEKTELTPKQIVAELNKYIVGQGEAKKSVSIALRNRWRRKRLSEDMQDEIIPKNILLIGPTGVGKTEIARRLAKLVGAPFINTGGFQTTEDIGDFHDPRPRGQCHPHGPGTGKPAL